MRMLAVSLPADAGCRPGPGGRMRFPQPQQQPGAAPVRLINACGQTYGLEGNILYFPGGGRHEIKEVDEAEAERVLRETYGLVGPRSALVHTRF